MDLAKQNNRSLIQGYIKHWVLYKKLGYNKRKFKESKCNFF